MPFCVDTISLLYKSLVDGLILGSAKRLGAVICAGVLSALPSNKSPSSLAQLKSKALIHVVIQIIGFISVWSQVRSRHYDIGLAHCILVNIMIGLYNAAV